MASASGVGRGSVWGCIVILLVGIPLGLLISWPQALGLHQTAFFAHLVSLRSAIALGSGILALLICLLAGVRALRVKRLQLSPVAALAGVLLLITVMQVWVLALRGADNDPARLIAAVAEDELRIVSWNTLGDANADVMTLPETSADTAQRAADILSAQGHDMTAYTVEPQQGFPNMPTSMRVSTALGEYELASDADLVPGIAQGVWEPSVSADSSTLPVLSAVHPMPTLPGVAMDHWKHGLQWITDLCQDPQVILAGDLNATMDHLSPQMGACQDAGLATGNAATGTWPSSVPPWLGAPIDHILVGSAWEVRDFTVLAGFDGAGSDHRPVVATVAPRG